MEWNRVLLPESMYDPCVSHLGDQDGFNIDPFARIHAHTRVRARKTHAEPLRVA
jgi:hypothetical protein